MAERDVVERLRSWCTDWNGARMADGEPPRDGLHCDELREAADEITALREKCARLREEKEAERARILALLRSEEAKLKIAGRLFDVNDGTLPPGATAISFVHDARIVLAAIEALIEGE